MKIRSHGDGATDFHVRKIHEADSSVILIDSVPKKDENYYAQVLSKNTNTLTKKKKAVFRYMY